MISRSLYLNGSILDGLQKQGRLLHDGCIYVFHWADQVAEGVRERRHDLLIVLYGSRIQLTSYHRHFLHWKNRQQWGIYKGHFQMKKSQMFAVFWHAEQLIASVCKIHI